MSVGVMSFVWADTGLRGTRKLLMLAIADSSNDDGECLAGRAELSSKAGVDERTVTRILADLADAGYVSIGRSSNHAIDSISVVMGGDQKRSIGRRQVPTTKRVTNCLPQRVTDCRPRVTDCRPSETNCLPQGDRLSPSPAGDTIYLTTLTSTDTRQGQNTAGAVAPAETATGRWEGFYDTCASLWAVPARGHSGRLYAWVGKMAHVAGSFTGDDPDESTRCLERWARSDEFRYAQNPMHAPARFGNWMTRTYIFESAVQR